MLLNCCCCWLFISICDEWGGAESRGNGARPVELMIMSDTCATHRSRVPRRSSGRIKGGATTVEDERGPGLDFNLCFVCGSRPWGAAALLLCLLICLLNFFKCYFRLLLLLQSKYRNLLLSIHTLIRCCEYLRHTAAAQIA